jgi:hypothetical protein
MRVHKKTGTKKILLVVGIVVGVLLLSGYLFINRYLTPLILHLSEELLQTRVEFSSVQVNFLEGSVTLKGFNIYHPDRRDEKIAEAKNVTFRLQYFPMLTKNLKQLEIDLDHPKFIFATTRTGDWELSNRIPLLRKGAGELRLRPFDIESVSVDEGELEFRDGRISAPPMITKLTKIKVRVNHLALPSLQNTLPTFFGAEFLIQNSGKVEIEGKGDFLSPKTSFNSKVRVKGISLPSFAPYYEHGLPVHVLQGIAAFSSELTCTKDLLNGPTHSTISGLKVELKDKKIFGFAADIAVGSLKDQNGNVALDLLITGNLQNFRILLLTDVNKAVMKGMTGKVEQVGKNIGHGVKSGFQKLKSVF